MAFVISLLSPPDSHLLSISSRDVLAVACADNVFIWPRSGGISKLERLTLGSDENFVHIVTWSLDGSVLAFSANGNELNVTI